MILAVRGIQARYGCYFRANGISVLSTVMHSAVILAASLTALVRIVSSWSFAASQLVRVNDAVVHL